MRGRAPSPGRGTPAPREAAPAAERFGRAYAADVFHDSPSTGKSYVVLTDVVYYLIFAAYSLFTASLQQQADWPSFTGVVTTERFGSEVRRIGGILLIVGVLHGLDIVVMPVLGRLFSLERAADDDPR